MKQNMGFTDRIIRVFFAVFFGIIYFTGLVSDFLGLVLLVIGVILLVTGIIGSCPLYSLLGFNTRVKSGGNPAKSE